MPGAAWHTTHFSEVELHVIGRSLHGLICITYDPLFTRSEKNTELPQSTLIITFAFASASVQAGAMGRGAGWGPEECAALARAWLTASEDLMYGVDRTI